jgi:lipoprotein-releasing system permease protein
MFRNTKVGALALVLVALGGWVGCSGESDETSPTLNGQSGTGGGGAAGDGGSAGEGGSTPAGGSSAEGGGTQAGSGGSTAGQGGAGAGAGGSAAGSGPAGSGGGGAGGSSAGSGGTNSANTSKMPPDPQESAILVFDKPAEPTKPWKKTQISKGIKSAPGSPFSPQAAPGIFGHGDIDGDGDIDLLVSGDGDPRVFWLEQKAPGQWETHVLEKNLAQAGGMVVTDLDGDGKNELIVTGYEANSIFVYTRKLTLPRPGRNRGAPVLRARTMGYPLTLATRYLRAKKAAFVSVGTAFAILGVALGVAALATVMSVTGGFQSQFREKVLGVNAHVLVLKYSADFREYRDIMKVVSELPGVEGVGPFTINPMMVSHGTRTATGVLLKGVDPDQMHRVLDLPKHLVEPREARETGRIDGLRRPGAKPAERPTDPKKSQGFSPFGDKPIPPDLPYEKDDQGRPKAVIQEIERSIREHEAKAQGSSSSKFEAAPAPAPASAPPGGSAPPASSAAPAEPAPEEDGPKPLAPGAPVGAVEPEGGYASRLPDAEDELDPSIVPDPCNDPALVAQMPGAIVGVTLARNLQLKLGDCLQVTSPTIGYSYSGRAMRPPVAKPFRVIGIFDAGFDQYDSKLVYTDLYEAQTFYDSGDSVTGVEMKVADIEKAREIARQIDARLANGIYHTMDWEELNHGLFTALRIQQIGMSSVLALIIVVAAFTVVATLIMVVLDKKKEIAVLKAMGATDGAILRVFLYQGGIIGGLGTALGLGLGLLVCKGLLVYGFKLDPKVYFISQLPVNVRPAEFLLTGFIAILICLVATVAPALYAARMRPADGLRELHLPSRNKEAEGPGNHGDDHPRGRGEFFSVDLRGGRVAPVGGVEADLDAGASPDLRRLDPQGVERLHGELGPLLGLEYPGEPIAAASGSHHLEETVIVA